MVWDPCDQGLGVGALEGALEEASDFFWRIISEDFKERRKVKRKQKSGHGECISIALARRRISFVLTLLSFLNWAKIFHPPHLQEKVAWLIDVHVPLCFSNHYQNIMNTFFFLFFFPSLFLWPSS